MEYDVLIVGGRVAGSSLALLLAQRGHRVLVVDRDRFPSDTLSTHFVGHQGVEMLAQLGVLADVEAAGFRRITRARTYIDDCLLEGPAGPAGTYGLVPRRTVLDAVLLDHAQRQGVEFREQMRAEGLIDEEGRVVGAHLRGVDDSSLAVRARVVVGADGRYSKVAEWVGAQAYSEVPPLRPGYYGCYHGVVPLAEPTMEMFFVRDTTAVVFPMRPGEDCLAIQIHPEEFDAFRTDPRAAFEERFRAFSGMAVRLKDATLEGKIRGTRGIPNLFRTPYGPGWALTGDAAFVKDPITGTGIGDALAQSFLLADALDAALRGADWEDALGAFQRRRDAKLLPVLQSTVAAAQLRDASPEALPWLRGLLVNPHVCRPAMQWLATALPGALPPELQPQMRRMARMFDAPAAVAAPRRSD